MNAPDKAELEALVRTLSERVGRHLEREGLLVRDLDSSYLSLEQRATRPALSGIPLAPTPRPDMPP